MSSILKDQSRTSVPSDLPALVACALEDANDLADSGGTFSSAIGKFVGVQWILRIRVCNSACAAVDTALIRRRCCLRPSLDPGRSFRPQIRQSIAAWPGEGVDINESAGTVPLLTDEASRQSIIAEADVAADSDMQYRVATRCVVHPVGVGSQHLGDTPAVTRSRGALRSLIPGCGLGSARAP